MVRVFHRRYFDRGARYGAKRNIKKPRRRESAKSRENPIPDRETPDAASRQARWTQSAKRTDARSQQPNKQPRGQPCQLYGSE